MPQAPEVVVAPAAAEPPPSHVPYKKLTIQEVAKWWDCSTATITRIARSDPDFPAPFKVGKAIIRFDRDELNAYLEKKRTREPLEIRAKKPEKQARSKGHTKSR